MQRKFKASLQTLVGWKTFLFNLQPAELKFKPKLFLFDFLQNMLNYGGLHFNYFCIEIAEICITVSLKKTNIIQKMHNLRQPED